MWSCPDSLHHQLHLVGVTTASGSGWGGNRLSLSPSFSQLYLCRTIDGVTYPGSVKEGSCQKQYREGRVPGQDSWPGQVSVDPQALGRMSGL